MHVQLRTREFCCSLTHVVRVRQLRSCNNGFRASQPWRLKRQTLLHSWWYSAKEHSSCYKDIEVRWVMEKVLLLLLKLSTLRRPALSCFATQTTMDAPLRPKRTVVGRIGTDKPAIVFQQIVVRWALNPRALFRSALDCAILKRCVSSEFLGFVSFRFLRLHL